jgi:hypothetical protein
MLHPFGTPTVLRATVGNLERNIVIRADLQEGCTESQHTENLQIYQNRCEESGLTFFECQSQFGNITGFNDCYWMKGYGVHMVTGEWNYGSEDSYLEALNNGGALPRTSIGTIAAVGVAFHDFGKLATEHRAFEINYFNEYASTDVANVIDQCVFRRSWFDALVIGKSPATTVTNNIVHQTLGIGIATGDMHATINWESRKPTEYTRRRRSMSVALKDLGRRVSEEIM